MLESKFKTDLIGELETLFPGCIVMHSDANDIQGFPDLIILYKNTWAALEGKRNRRATKRPNQEYYVELLNTMSYAAFIYPENKEEVLYELQQTFEPRRKSRFSKR